MLDNPYKQFIHKSRYARWDYEKGRRENWNETVERYISFFKKHLSEKYPNFDQNIIPWNDLYQGIFNLEVMPSMRALMTAGKALEKHHIAGYNCAYGVTDNPRFFDEVLYILMHGTGIGFSVERQYVNKLPEIPEELYPTDTCITIMDSKLGWAKGYRELIAMLYAGHIPKYDLSKLRPEGSILKTFGGRASGPEPLRRLFEFTINLFKNAKGRKLTSIECHELLCNIAETVVVGGVRRCHPAGTQVLMSDSSWKNIEEIKKGDKVFIENGHYEVTNVFDNGEQEVIKILAEDNKWIECTPNHRWYVYNHSKDEMQWVEAQHLLSDNYYFAEERKNNIDQFGKYKLTKIINIFYEEKIKRVYDIEVEQVHMFTAKNPDTELKAISHNSAMISLSNLSDDRMRKSKTGEWWMNKPYLRLSNNSAVYTENPEPLIFLDEWKSLIESQAGERGIFSRYACKDHISKRVTRRDSNHEWGSNPCQRYNTPVLTKNGISKLGDINIGEYIWSETGWVKVINKVCNGIKDVYKYHTNAGDFYSTDTHRILQNGEKIEVKNAKSIDILKGCNEYDFIKNDHDPIDIMDGLVIGDGNKTNKKYIELNIGCNDQDYFNSEISHLILKKYGGVGYIVKTSIEESELDKKPYIKIPDRYFYSNAKKICGFLRGLFSANGNVLCNNKSRIVGLRSSSKILVEQVQVMLSSIGIKSYITTDKKKNVKFNNGTYECKESYKINITNDIDIFDKYIGFIHKYKNKKVQEILNTRYKSKYSNHKEKTTFEIKKVEYVGKELVYDITVDNAPHTYWSYGFNTSNCSEIILRPFEFCVGGNTPLITKNKIDLIKNFENKEVEIYNGEEWSKVIVRKTRNNKKLYRVYLTDGSFLDCTEDHKWSVKTRFQKEWNKIETKNLMNYSKYSIQCQPFDIVDECGNLQIKNPYELGFAIGDGYFINENNVQIDLYGEKINLPIKGKRYKEYQPKNYNVKSQRINIDIDIDLFKKLRDEPNEILNMVQYKKEDIISFISGWLDADGSNQSNGVRLYVTNEEKARNIQLLLTRIGIKSSVNLMSKKGTITNFGIRKDDIWYLQITKTSDLKCKRLMTENIQSPKYKGKYQNIVKVVDLNLTENVFCFNEEKKGMGVFNNVLTYQCNLSEVICRENDTEESLLRKIRLATILGTIQSTLTDFKYLRNIWKKNCEEERLLGVSLTGIRDCPVINNVSLKTIRILIKLKKESIKINKELCQQLGINQSVAISCCKPSGTVSALVDSSSGIHPRFSEYYIRRVRNENKNPITKFLIDSGIPHELDKNNPNETVFSFPMKSPKNSIFVKDVTAIDQLNFWKMFQIFYCEHKPSCTIYVKPHEWIEVAAWVYKNMDLLSGVSFLPYSDHIYQQAPFEPISKEKYEELIKDIPKSIDWNQLINYEKEDYTVASQEYACSASGCELK